MSNTSLALWHISVALAVPVICMLGLALFWLRRKRNRQSIENIEDNARGWQAPAESFGRQIHQEIVSQQIDAVFDALATILETERLKLKTMILSSQPNLCEVEPRQCPAATHDEHPQQNTVDADEEEDLLKKITSMCDQGLSQAEIAREMGLSQNEVALAVKMHQCKAVTPRSRLQAVA